MTSNWLFASLFQVQNELAISLPCVLIVLWKNVGHDIAYGKSYTLLY